MLLALAACAVGLAPAHEACAKGSKQAAIVVDANTGKVLHAQSADELRFPASLTKMMTLYILFGEIEQGRLSYESKIKFSKRATGVSPSKLGLKAGEEIEVLDAIKALIVKSANDVAVAVAEHIGGTEYKFAQLMTERARQIGMASTTFRNASGLPNTSQRSTARDMVTLGLRLQDDFPKYYPLFATASFTYRGKTYKSHNTLAAGFPGMDGIKTGYTRASGFNLVSSVRADGKHIVGAVFGGKTAATRNAHMRSLLYTALQKASTNRTRSPQLIAKARPAKQMAAASADVAWATKTKAAAAAKPAPKPPVKTVAAVQAPPPAPAPAVRPARDAIADVLAEGDEASNETDAASVAPPRLDLQALRAAMSDAAPGGVETQTLQDKGGALQDKGGAPQDIASLIRNSIVEGTPGQSATAGAAVRPPSTLDSQARALTAFVAPAQAGAPNAGEGAAPSRPTVQPSNLKGPVPPSKFPAAPVGVGYEIQIGAYGTSQEAQSKLDLVRTRAVGLLDGHDGMTLPVQRDDRQIFRARFVRFDENAATNACLELRRLAIDCFVMRAD